MSSCRSTVFMLSEYMTGYFSMIFSMSKFGGNLDRMSAARSRHVSAGLLPPELLVWRGRVSRMLLKSCEVEGRHTGIYGVKNVEHTVGEQ